MESDKDPKITQLIKKGKEKVRKSMRKNKMRKDIQNKREKVMS